MNIISALDIGAVLFMVSILPGFAATTYVPSLVLERVLYYRSTQHCIASVELLSEGLDVSAG